MSPCSSSMTVLGIEGLTQTIQQHLEAVRNNRAIRALISPRIDSVQAMVTATTRKEI